MPQNCNGLMLIDQSKDFCKHNCQWTFNNTGKKPDPKKNPKEIKRKKSGIKNPKSICLVMEREHIDFIKSQALQRSIQEGTYVEPNQLIREALQKAFPAPKQFDMFGDRMAK